MSYSYDLTDCFVSDGAFFVAVRVRYSALARIRTTTQLPILLERAHQHLFVSAGIVLPTAIVQSPGRLAGLGPARTPQAGWYKTPTAAARLRTPQAAPRRPAPAPPAPAPCSTGLAALGRLAPASAPLGRIRNRTQMHSSFPCSHALYSAGKVTPAPQTILAVLRAPAPSRQAPAFATANPVFQTSHRSILATLPSTAPGV